LAPQKKDIAYEMHNYSAIDNYLSRQNERRELLIKERNGIVTNNLIKFSSLCFLAVSLGILLVIFGLWVLKDEKIKVVEKEVVREKLATVELTLPENFLSSEAGKIQTRIQSLEKLLINQNESDSKIVSSNSKNPSKNNSDSLDVSTEFTVFRKRPSRIYGFNSVITGLVYKNSQATYPDNQYCYIEKPGSRGTELTVYLNTKNGRGAIIPILYADVARTGLTSAQYKVAKSKCVFLN